MFKLVHHPPQLFNAIFIQTLDYSYLIQEEFKKIYFGKNWKLIDSECQNFFSNNCLDFILSFKKIELINCNI